MANAPRPDIPDGTPTGWSFDEITDSSEPKAEVAVNEREGWDDDVVIDDANDDRISGARTSNAGYMFYPQRIWVYTKVSDAQEHENRM